MDASKTQQRIGFVGLGGMGVRMAGRILDAGFPMAVWNRTRERAEGLGKRGARVAGSAREVAEGSDVVITMVSDDAALQEVTFGPGGVMEGTGAGRVVVDMSTVSPGASERVHVAARAKGAAALDAPVSGSLPQAERGELVIFVGGEAGTLERCRGPLSAMGRVVPTGRAGDGARMKLCVNLMLGLGMQAVAEALALGTGSGLDPSKMIDVLSDTAVVSASQKAKMQNNVAKGEYSPTFPLRLMHKDLNLILAEAARLNVPVPAVAAAAQWFAAEHARQRADGNDQDFSAIVPALMKVQRRNLKP